VEHICIVAEGYPTEDNPIFSFVDQLVCEISDLGWKCSVIAPQSITKILFRGAKKRPFKWQKVTKNGTVIDIYQPLYLSLSNNKRFNDFANESMKSACENTFKFIHKKCRVTVCYAHFWHCAMYIGNAAKKYNLPLFVACGESNISVHKRFKNDEIHNRLKMLRGVISVSTENMLQSIELGLAEKEAFTVLPNGINANVFYKADKKEARKKLGICEDDFVVGFVGSFIERKGPLRLSEAIRLTGKDIKSIFIGSGAEEPFGEGIIFKGKLPHNKIREYLNACDVFVLPTLSEGCCNAIVEAMACGLPVISSDKIFNDDILDETCSIRIDTSDVEAIKNAIIKLYDDELRNALAAGALKKAGGLKIEQRAKKIMEFISDRK